MLIKTIDTYIDPIVYFDGKSGHGPARFPN